MKHNTKDFDCEAATWDDEPRRVKLVRDIADTISRAIELNPNMDVLDFGCGTGLLTLHLSPLVHSVTGVDSSKGMLDVLNAKTERHGFSNVKSQYLDIGNGDILHGRYHLIVTSMTLHHVREISPLLSMFYDVLERDGHLCIADLDLDDGKFHQDNHGVFHFGFDRAILRQSMLDAKFDDVREITAAEIIKPLANGADGLFTVFLMVGRKKPNN
jgi:2-polyprenyl-3-methyl-5-hydroxy-6-metoxy-1,4-benzoquinol methylase